MRYHNSNHFREDPAEEINAALAAGNSYMSVQSTIEARLQTEQNYAPIDYAEIDRLNIQLSHLGNLALQSAA